MQKRGLLLIVALLIAACDTDPAAQYQTGEILLRESFNTARTWDDRSRDNVEIGARAGAYRMAADVSSYVRGFERSTRYDNVVIEVESSLYSREDNNAFGVMCRASTDDSGTNGYYFLIGADGSYSIRIGEQREVNGLVKWSTARAINRGVGNNRIRAICIDDYLALYVNDVFVADVFDDTYRQGYLGFVAATEAGTQIEVAFDNLIVFDGSLID